MSLPNLLKHSQRVLIKTALATVIAALNTQLPPAYAMQRESLDGEQEPTAHKVAQNSLLPNSQHDNIIDDYVEPYGKVSTQKDIPHSVRDSIDKKNKRSSSSSRTNTHKKQRVSYLAPEKDTHPEGEKRSPSGEVENKQIESSKRKRVEKETKSTRGTSKHKKSRADKKEEINSLFRGLPPEMWSHIASFIRDPQDIANCRMVSREMKDVMDKLTNYHLSLQRLSTLATLPVSFTGEKLYLRGWAPNLTSVLPLLSSEPSKILGKIFVSSLGGNIPDNTELGITLTIPDDKQAELKLAELEKEGLSKIVDVRSRESLWNDFIKTDFIENHQSKNLIINNKGVLSILLDIDGNGELARTILSRFQSRDQLIKLSNAFARIHDESQRAYVASLLTHVAPLLNEKILSLCQTGTHFQQVIEALAKISIKEPRKLIFLSKKIVDKCQDGSQLCGVIEACANIPIEKFKSIILFLETSNILDKCQNGSQLGNVIRAITNIFVRNPKILGKCQDENQLSEVIWACANIPIAEFKSIILLVEESAIIGRCHDGSQLSNVIEACANIPDEDTRKDVISLMYKKTLDNSLDKDRVKVIMNALARIKDTQIRWHVAKIIQKQIFNGCETNHKAGAFISSLASISKSEIREYIGSYLTIKILEKCRDGSQVRLIISTLAKITDLPKLRRIATLISHKKYLEKYQNGEEVSLVINAFSKIEKANIREEIDKRLNKKILEKINNGNQLSALIEKMRLRLETK